MRAFAFLTALGLVILPDYPAPAAEPAGELRIGMLSGMFRDVPSGMVHSLAKPFRDLMTKQVGYDGDVEMVDDPLTLAEKMKDGKVQLGVFHGFEFAWAKQRCDDLVPLIVTRPPGGKVQAMVVVHRTCAAKGVSDLKSECVHIPRGAKAHSLAFLDKCRIGLDSTTCKPTPKVNQTPEDVLNAVATGDATAALVDTSALEGYKALQPGGYKSLRILSESELFPAAVVCYRKGTLSEADVTRIRTGLATATKSSSGKMLMALWNLKGFEEPPADYQNSLDTILKSYPLPTDKTAVSVEKSAVKAPGTGGK
jgi:ABC-type phosphate/phosphonate transport system substrate-binding protein